MGFIRFFTKKSIFVNLVAIFVTCIGAFTFLTTSKEVFPQIKIGYLVVSVVYPQAGSTEMEKLITIPIENAIEDIEGIKEITSWSSEGLSMIGIELEPYVKDTKKVMDDVKAEVDKVQDLPEEAEDPEVIEISTDFFPLINLSVSGGKNYTELRDAATYLEDKIEEVKGVGEITKVGYYDRAIWIDADKGKLKDYGLTLFNFINVLRDRDISMPAGNKVFGDRVNAIRLMLPMENAEEVENVIIRSNEMGKKVRVRDVAKVTDGFKDEDFYMRAQGHRAILMEIKKQKNFDTIKMVKGIRDLVAKEKKALPESVDVTFSNDFSIYLKNRLEVLYSNGLFGALLVILMLLLLLRPSIAVMTALGMPVAFATAFYVAHSIGIDLNMMSILGYIMVLGMVVDDAIVVGENVYRHMEMGKPPLEAAVQGAQEMFLPVIASVTTTIAAFLPLMLVGGMMGQFLSAIPKVIIIALSASLMECFFILPSHLADFVKQKKDLKLESTQEHWFNVIRNIYGNMLGWVLKHRVVFAVLILVAMVVATVLESKNGMVFTDAQTQTINIELKCDKEFSVDNTEAVVKGMEQKVLKLDKKDLDVVDSYVGMINDQHGPPRFGPNLAQLNVQLHIEDERKTKDANAIVNHLREAIGKPEGVKELKIEAVKGGPPTGSAIDVKISGDEYQEIEKVANDFMDQVKAIEMEAPHHGHKKEKKESFKPVTEIKTDFEEGKNEIRLVIDEGKASIAGVSLSQAGNVLRAAVAGIKLKTIKKLGENIDVMIRVDENSIKTLPQLLDVRVPNQMGNLIPLKEIVRVEKGTAYATLIHKDGKRTISVIGAIDKEKTNVHAVGNKIEAIMEKFRQKYPNFRFDVGGEQEEMMEGFMDLAKAFGVAIFLIFIILATLFNSLAQPLIIMLAIPFGFLGVMLTLLVHGMPISFMAFMGFVGLSGVVVNDSLILVSFINNLIGEGKAMEDAIIEGAKTRLRPVILTTVTTTAGLLPLAYGWFGGDEPMIRPMAVVFAWGLAFATMITLFIIPCFWVIAKNAKTRIRRLFGRGKEVPIIFGKKKPQGDIVDAQIVADQEEPAVPAKGAIKKVKRKKTQK